MVEYQQFLSQLSNRSQQIGRTIMIDLLLWDWLYVLTICLNYKFIDQQPTHSLSFQIINFQQTIIFLYELIWSHQITYFYISLLYKYLLNKFIKYLIYIKKPNHLINRMSDYSISDDSIHYNNYSQDQSFHSQYQGQSYNQNYQDHQQSQSIQYEAVHFNIYQQELNNPYQQSEQSSVDDSPPNQMENEDQVEYQESNCDFQIDNQSIVESDSPFEQQPNQSLSMESESEPQPEPQAQSSSMSSQFESQQLFYLDPNAHHFPDLMVHINHSMENVNRLVGLSQNQINQFPLVNWKYNSTSVQTDMQCTICIQNYKLDDQLRLFPCLHKFHKNCIDKWLTTNSLCPNCRTDFKNKN